MDKHTEIGENEINIELTEQAKKNPKYELYKNWLRSNGVLWKDIDFPVAFGPSGVIGVAAAKDVSHSSAIIAVPNSILITTTKVENGELKEFMSDSPQLFKDNEDADFNILTVFLLREKLKGQDSFYYPLLGVIDNDIILFHWKEEEIKELEDPSIKSEAKFFEKEMDDDWVELQKAFAKYPDLFPLDKVTKEDYIWCHETVMTRCFGWSLPATMLVPMADFLNHSPDGTTHYVVNTEYERKGTKIPDTYVMKQKKIDLAIFNDEELVLSEEDKEIFLAPVTSHLDFVRKHSGYLPADTKDMITEGSYRKQDLKRAMREINLEILKRDKNKQLWDLIWNESSDDEDNDTDDEDDEEEEEEGKEADKNNGDKEEKVAERKTEEGDSNKVSNEENKDNQSTATKDSNGAIETKDRDEAANSDSGEEDDGKVETEEQKREKEKYKFGGGILTEAFSPTKCLDMRNNVSEYERQEMEKIKLKKSQASNNKEKKEKEDKEQAENKEEEEEEEDDDDSDWSWFNDSDNRNYFVVATHPYLNYRKGDQIFNCYGRRTNRFLIMWYGFCVQNNRYNSLTFRLWMNKTTLNSTSPPQKILFKDYISQKEYDDRALIGEEKSNPEDLTKEFRVKVSSLCEDVLTYLRAQLLLTYKGPDLRRIMVTMPTSIPYEEFVIDYAISLFIEIKNQFRTSLYQDEEILKDYTMHYRKRFAVVYRLEQKRIAETQLNLLKILLNFMSTIKAGVSFKDAYMERVADVDHTDDDFMENRRKISSYLKLFYHNYTV